MNNKKTLNTLLIIVVSSLLVGWYVYSNHTARHYPSIEKVERNTKAVEAQIEALSQHPDLPSLSDSWDEVEIIASTYGVNVKPLKNEEDIRLTNSDLPGGEPWYGALQGSVTRVSAAALEIQQRLPVIYGYAVIENETMGLSFAVFGITE